MRISDNDIREYKIKTTSNMILDEFNKNTAKPKFRLKFGISLSSLLVIATSIVLLLALFLPNSSTKNSGNHNNLKTSINVNEETLNFQVNSLVSIISNEEKVNNNTRLSFGNPLEFVDDFLFDDAIKEYQKFEDVIYNKYYKIEENFTYTYDNYHGSLDDYNLMIGFNEYKVYINYTNFEDDEAIFSGEILIDGTIYKIEGKEEREEDELELSTKIYISDNVYYKVEEEYENDEYSYKFQVKSKDRDKYEYKLKIEEEEISFKLESGNKKFEYEIEASDRNNWKIVFKNNDNRFDFSLEIDGFGKKNYKKNY